MAKATQFVFMDDYWIGAGCTNWEFARSTPTKALELRRNYLTGLTEESHWPFVHGVCRIQELWFKDSWGLDPLVIPLLQKLNTLPGVRTYCSCQGNKVRGPSIGFLGDPSAAKLVLKLTYKLFKHDHKGAIIALTGERKVAANDANDALPDGTYTAWHIWFYDTLSLIQFNRDCLGIPVEKQVKMYVETALRDPSCLDQVVFADPKEIEGILDYGRRT